MHNAMRGRTRSGRKSGARARGKAATPQGCEDKSGLGDVLHSARRWRPDRAARRRGYTPQGAADVRAPSNAPSDEGMMRPRSEEVFRG